MRILNFGSLNIDYVYKVDHFVRGGETLSADRMSIFCGGKGLNQSVAMGRAGLDVYHAGSIGKDGMFLLDMLRSAGVNTDNVRIRNDVMTGNAVIQNDNEGDNCIIINGGANQAIDDEQVDRTMNCFTAGDYLVLQNEINDLPYIAEHAHTNGMKIVLNPSPMDKKVLELDLQQIDWFILNEIEACQLSGVESDDEQVLLNALLGKFPQAHIVITLGDRGSCYADRDKTCRQDIYKARVVDTTAAGDTFTGYLMAGIVNGYPIEKCLDMASKAAAIAVTRSGAAPSIPTIQEVTDWPTISQ